MKSADLSSFSRPLQSHQQKQRGVALITAVMIVAIASVIATSLMSRQNFDTLRTSNIIHSDQARIYAQGAENWIGTELKDDRKKNNYDHLGENWAAQLPPLPIEGGYIYGRIEDLQGRINLNNIIDPEQQKRLERLCTELGISTRFIPALQDWIDTDLTQRPNGAEDLTYMGMNPPYRAANTSMAHPSQLLLVQHMNTEDYEKLLPYITTLPATAAINVNTAPPRVIQSLVPNFTFPEAEQIAANRVNSPYQAVNDLAQEPLMQGRTLNPQLLTTQSEYFLLTTEVELGSAYTVSRTLIHRSNTGVLTTLHRLQGPSREMILKAAL